jgi:hypothetical protein
MTTHQIDELEIWTLETLVESERQALEKDISRPETDLWVLEHMLQRALSICQQN